MQTAGDDYDHHDNAFDYESHAYLYGLFAAAFGYVVTFLHLL